MALSVQGIKPLTCSDGVLLQVLAVATASPYIIALGAAAAGILPVTLLACLTASLQPAKQLLDYAFENHSVPAKIAPLKKFGVKWHIAVGLCLTAGLAISGGQGV